MKKYFVATCNASELHENILAPARCSHIPDIILSRDQDFAEKIGSAARSKQHFHRNQTAADNERELSVVVCATNGKKRKWMKVRC